MAHRPDNANREGVLGGEGKGPSANQPALLKRFQDDIKALDDEWEQALKRINKARRYADGEIGDDEGEDMQVRANLILATQQALLPHVYAKNPEYAIRPRHSVSPMVYPMMRKFGETLEIVIEDELKGARLKPQMKALVRAAYTSRIGAVKVTWQEEYGRDPVAMERIQDAQDQLAHIQSLTAELTEGDAVGSDREAKMVELENTIAALQAESEVLQAKGITLDIVPIDDLRIPNIRSLGDYRRAPWIAHRTYWRVPDAKDLLGLTDEQLGNYTTYYYGADGYTQAAEHRGKTGEDMREDERYLCMWERWDKRTLTIYTFAEGGDRWLKEPFQLDCAGTGWYGFFLMSFHWIDGKRWPKSDVELQMELQDEYNRTRTNMAEHRAISIPHWIADASQDERSIRRFEHADIGEVIVVEANGKPLDQVFVAAPMPNFDPRLYDTQPIRSDLEWISGLGDAQRGSVERAKTLGEAAILREGFADRTSERRDEIEQLLQDIAEYIAPMLLYYRSADEVRTIAGPEAVWPTLNKQQLHDLQIEIRAGSTGQPNKDQEREQWMALYPQMLELIEKVYIYRAQGVPDDLNPYVLLMEELIKRFDERLDIDQFIPGRYEQQQQPGAGPAAGPLVGPDGQPLPVGGLQAVGQPGSQPGAGASAGRQAPGRGGNGQAGPPSAAQAASRPLRQPMSTRQ